MVHGIFFEPDHLAFLLHPPVFLTCAILSSISNVLVLCPIQQAHAFFFFVFHIGCLCEGLGKSGVWKDLPLMNNDRMGRHGRAGVL